MLLKRKLIMLFYNAFSNPKFKDIIEKYALLQNLRVELLASQADISLYKQKFSPDKTNVEQLSFYCMAEMDKNELRKIRKQKFAQISLFPRTMVKGKKRQPDSINRANF